MIVDLFFIGFLFYGAAFGQLSDTLSFERLPPDDPFNAVVIGQSATISAPKPIIKPLRNDPERCQDILRFESFDAISVVRQEGIIAEAEDTSRTNIFSTLAIGETTVRSGCAPRQDGVNCSDNSCYHLRYRTMDGTCNNLQRPLFGSAATPFIRFRKPNYDDGILEVTGFLKNDRPSARDVSRFVLINQSTTLHPQFNSILMQFGQFVAHDLAKTALLPRQWCDSCTHTPGLCAPIKIDSFDQSYECPRFPCCLPLARAAGTCGTGSDPNNPRLQLNENTAFLDGSAVYGSSLVDMVRLRSGPFMKTTVFNGSSYLPFDLQSCRGPDDCDIQFDAGDSRFVIFIGLAAFHTLMLREHNRLVSQLQLVNGHWSDERLYQEARKILGAELQLITYRDWLPKILGYDFVRRYIGDYAGYEANVDTSVSAEFTYAGMRFGHGMIRSKYDRLDSDNNSIPQGPMLFEEGVLRPQKLLFEGGIEALLRGMLITPIKMPQRVAAKVTERLFNSADLASISVQRARDAGLSSYNDMRQVCGMLRAQDFEDFAGEIKDKQMRDNLKQGFVHVDKVDLYAGALVEDPVDGAIVGPTMACLIGDQFRRLRDGDRFWYENTAVFTHKQILELHKTSIGRILCDNMADFHFAPSDAFLLPSGNLTRCTDIPAMDLSEWSD